MKDIVTLTNIRVSAFGRGSKLRGLRHGAYRPDLIVLDDFENDQGVATKEQRDKTMNIYRKSILNLGDENTQVIIVGTILHEFSMLNVLLKMPHPGWIAKTYRAILEDGSSLWAERFTPEYWENKKLEITPEAFSQEFQNIPMSEMQKIFHLKKFYVVLPDKLIKYAYMDLAISEKETADFCALDTIGIDPITKKGYNIDPIQFRGDVYMQLEKLFEYWQKHKHEKIGIESVAYQKAFYQLSLNEGRKRGLYLPVTEVKVDTDKVRRAKKVAVYTYNETVEFCSSHEEFNYNLEVFPQGEHDDYVDAFVGACEVAGIVRSNEIYLG